MSDNPGLDITSRGQFSQARPRLIWTYVRRCWYHGAGWETSRQATLLAIAMLGEKLGKYQILDEVGQGGMSVVYRARDTALDRCVAVKVLHPHLSRREESKKRFEREARAIAKLSHPNILQVFDFSEAGASASYIVMEYLDGYTLRQFVERHTLDHPEVAALIGVHLCRALSHAHDLGIIHRDIKPENVMLTQGAIKLMDFGIAEIVDAQTMTATGTLLGSPAHMSPEMIEGHELDYRADIFSLGTVLYFVATGELPFSARNAPLVLKAILEGDYLSAEMINPRVGRRLSRLIDRCMAHDPDDRFASVVDLEKALTQFLHDSGLEDIDAEIEAFLLDPDGHQAALGVRLIEAFEQRGLAALKEHRIPVALEYFNRVLSIEPNHERVLSHIRNIDRRRRRQVYLWGAGAFVACAMLTLGIGALVSPNPQDDPSDPSSAELLAATPSIEAQELDAERTAQALTTSIVQSAAAVAEQRSGQIDTRLRTRTQALDAATEAIAQTISTASDEAQKAAQERAGESSTRPSRIARVVPEAKTTAKDSNTPAETDPDLAASTTGGSEHSTSAEPKQVQIRLTIKLFPNTKETTLRIAGKSYNAPTLANGVQLTLPHDQHQDRKKATKQHIV
ncbi:MAG: protein kinase, partial [Myxococcota bacterium]